jgi:hypothetical protein
MKTYGGMEEYLHYSWPCRKTEVSGQLHGPAALHPGKELPVPIG